MGEVKGGHLRSMPTFALNLTGKEKTPRFREGLLVQ